MRKFKLVSDVRLLFNGSDEIRIRSGLWNYNEAIIDLAPLKQGCKQAVKQMLQGLQGSGFAEEDIKGLAVTKEDQQQLQDLLLGLLNAGMIYSSDDKNLRDRVTDVILGKIKDSLVQSDLKHSRVLFVSDCSYNSNLAKELAKQLNFNMNYADVTFVQKVAKHDLTTHFDALKTERSLSAIYELVKEYDAFVISLKHTNMLFLRNMNRVCLEYNKKMTVGMLDGPFVTAFSINPPHTGCAECFENRILARLEDHALYERYVQNDLVREDSFDAAKVVLSSILTNVLVSEAFLIANYSLTKFEGRVLSIFYPTLEIQTQELLRVPFCPACGKVSKANFEELNIQSRVIVDDLLKTMTNTNK